jgi:hypothetical protein
VVVIPTRDGLVIAADSRSTVQGQYLDGVVKLHVARTKRPIVVSITGTSDFAHAPPAGISLQDWFPKATYEYRGTSFVQAYLDNRPDTVLSASVASTVAEAFATSLGAYFDTRPAMKSRFVRQDLCRLVLAQAGSDGSMLYASVPLSLDSEGRVIVGANTFKAYRPHDEKAMEYIGEDRYTTEHVLGSHGTHLLDQRAADLWNVARRIDDMSAADASFVAAAIIRAAEETTRVVPVPSGNGIGGPPMAYLITSQTVVSLPMH